MNAAQPDLQDANSSAGDEIDWRTALVTRIRLVVVAFVFLSSVATLIGARSDLMRAFGIALIILSVLLAASLWSSRISTRVKSFIMIAGLSAIGISAYIISAYLPGGAMTFMFALGLASLLIGRRVFIGLFIAFTIFAIGLVVAVATGWWTGPALVDFNPAAPMNWLRVTLIGSLLWGSLGFSVLFVVDTIERNLSTRLAALESLKKENSERRAAERARRDAEQIAAQAQKMEAIGQLAAGIAHDFNNALLVIQGWNEIRGTQDSSESETEATAAIQQSVSHTAQLSRQLLTFARKDVRTPKYFYLDRFVDETAKTLQNLVGANIEIHTNSEEGKVIYADESQIQQLLFNLVINARDAIGSTGNIRISVAEVGGGDVDVSEAATPNRVVLAVEDDGHGIDDQTKARMFEPFFTTKGMGEGSGLGLSTVFGIVKQHDGRIDVASEPGRTVFSLYFPSARIDQVDVAAGSKPQQGAELDLRVLLLEDDVLAQQMLVTVLEGHGCEVVTCADGDAALSLLKTERQPFDLFLSDAVFPGAELETVVEAFERHSPSAGVLICSGYIQQELAIKKVESGEYAFLSKPFTAAGLVEKICEAVGAVGESN